MNLEKLNVFSLDKKIKKINPFKKNLTKCFELNKKTSVNQKTNLIIPQFQDTLFWCYYIILNGNCEYVKKNFIIEQKIKLEFIEKSNFPKDTLKKLKIKKKRNPK